MKMKGTHHSLIRNRNRNNNADPRGCRPQSFGIVRHLGVRLLLSAALLLSAGITQAFPVNRNYYVPFPEGDVLTALTSMRDSTLCNNNFPTNPVSTYISVVALLDGTQIIYDHWEDGYEPDINKPVQSSTEIWGDGDASNGVPPGFPNTDAGDHLDFGANIILEASIDTTVDPTPTPDPPAKYDFSARDKLSSSLSLFERG